MHDYWNDPPEYPDLPECCGQEMTVKESGDCVCDICGRTIEKTPDIEPVDEQLEWFHGDTEPPQESECPHGKKLGDCSACDYASDIAYDTARERIAS